jgi:hypothetical protein
MVQVEDQMFILYHKPLGHYILDDWEKKAANCEKERAINTELHM